MRENKKKHLVKTTNLTFFSFISVDVITCEGLSFHSWTCFFFMHHINQPVEVISPASDCLGWSSETSCLKRGISSFLNLQFSPSYSYTFTYTSVHLPLLFFSISHWGKPNFKRKTFFTAAVKSRIAALGNILHLRDLRRLLWKSIRFCGVRWAWCFFNFFLFQLDICSVFNYI